jgi:hypothetical protein
MSNLQKVESIIQNIIEGTQALPNSRAAKAMASLIVRDLFRADNLEAIQDYLSEIIEPEAPDADLKWG